MSSQSFSLTNRAAILLLISLTLMSCASTRCLPRRNEHTNVLLTVYRVSGGPAPYSSQRDIYKDGEIRFWGRKQRCAQLAKVDLDQVNAMVASASFLSLLERLDAEDFEARYADVQRIEIELDGKITTVPLREVDLDLSKVLAKIDALFESYLGRRYSERLTP